MKKILYCFVLSAILSYCFASFADSKLDMPLSIQSKMLELEPALEFPALNMEKIKTEDNKRLIDGLPFRISISHLNTNNDFDAKGKWQTQGDMSVWRLPLKAKDAVSLSFGFENVFLPPGAKLFVHDGKQVIGPYTERDNKQHKELWTPLLKNDHAVIEINIPTVQKAFLSFAVKSIEHGYRDVGSLKFAKSGSCNIDVVCKEGDDWRPEIRSVASYLVSVDGGRGACTGQLVNNTAGDLKPYFLTASHCVSTQEGAQSMVFSWNFETSECGGTPNGNRDAQSQSGASLRAKWGGEAGDVDLTDMALVELDTKPREEFNVHYAGWDNNDIAPTSVVAIHHPQGDEKRISFDDDPLTITDYATNAEKSTGTHLRVAAWNKGTTEGGSSGSAIWNAERRIVGTLSGGGASCESPNEPDWYGRLAMQWEGGGTRESQLKAWLDPANSGAKVLNGMDTCMAPTADFSVNTSAAEVGQSIAFTSTVSGGSGGPYTYAWDFNGDGTVDSNLASPTYTYNSSYRGNVRVTISDSASCSRVVSKAIVVSRAGGNAAPVARVAQANMTVNEGAEVRLDASSSTDADRDTLTYAWAQSSGSTVNLSNATTSIATFTAPAVVSNSSMAFEVTVTDSEGASTKATVNVTVNNSGAAPAPAPSPAAPSSSSGGGSFGYLLLFLIFVVMRIKYNKLVCSEKS